jgi:membrane-associated phospholipid phosphatase
MSRHHPVHRIRTLSWFGWWAAAHAGLLLVLAAFQWDKRLSGTLCSWGSSGASRTRLIETLTSWGNPWPVTLLAAGSACFALTRRNVAAAAVLLAVPYAATVSCNLIKGWVERQRPTLGCASAQADGFSFPSGHAVGVTTGFLLAALYLSTHTPRAVSALILLLTGVAAELVAWSRVFLGVHFSIDVLAGQLLGGCWLALGAFLLHRRPVRSSRKQVRRGASDTAERPVT